MSTAKLQVSEPVFARGMIFFAAIAFAIFLAASIPGNLGIDGSIFLCAGRSGVFGDWHPPMNAALMGFGDRIVEGPLIPYLLAALAYFTAIVLLIRRWISKPWVQWAAVFVLLLNPVFTAFFINIVKDQFYFAALLLAWAAFSWKRWTWGYAALILATLFRHNGPLIALGFLTFFPVPRFEKKIRTRVFATAAAWLGLLAVSWGFERAVVNRHEFIEQYIYIQDVIGVSLDLNEPLYLKARPDISEKITLEEIRPFYTYDNSDVLFYDPAFTSKVSLLSHHAGEVAAWRTAWMYTILHHPISYLKLRAVRFSYLMGFHTQYSSFHGIGMGSRYFCDLAKDPQQGREVWPGQALRIEGLYRAVAGFHDRNTHKFFFTPAVLLLALFLAGLVGFFHRQQIRQVFVSPFSFLISTVLIEGVGLFFFCTASYRRYFSWGIFAAYFAVLLVVDRVRFQKADQLIAPKRKTNS